jgi:hypothetical protein
MKLLAIVLVAAVALALVPTALARPILPVREGVCTNLDPLPAVCVSLYFGNINDFCVTVGPATKCEHFIGPVLG